MLPHWLSYNCHNFRLIVASNCPPHATLTIATCVQNATQSILHSSKVCRRHKTEGTTAKNGTNNHQYSMDTYRGVSGQAVATKYSTCRWLNWHHLSTVPERGAISSWSKFFSHTVLRRNSWPLDLCIETQPADFSTPIHWNDPRRDAIKMDKGSSPEQTERAIDSSRHALIGDVFRISQFRHQLVICGTRRGRSWSKSAKIYVSEMVFDS